MSIRVQFPFDHCEKCKFIEPDTNTSQIYGDEKVIINDVTVYCRNEDLCKNLYENLKDLECKSDAK